MRIGFDAKRLYNNFTGLGNYSRTLVGNLLHYTPGDELLLYTPRVKQNPETADFLNNPALKTVTASGFCKSTWRSWGVKSDLRRDKVQIYHGLSHDMPFGIQNIKGLRGVVTIHDVCYKTFPDMFPRMEREIYEVKYRHSCRHADRIIAISDSTKHDLVKLLGVNPDKIDVIYQAINPTFYTPQPEQQAKAMVKHYGVSGDYILYVGSINSRKNLLGLLKAYHLLPEDLRLPLVIIGNGGKYKEQVMRYAETHDLTRYMVMIDCVTSSHTLQAFYQCASLFVYPSFYEGFGLPVTEAILSHTPVITSNISSLPEAAGEGAYYADPSSEEDLAAAMERILTSKSIRDEMVEVAYRYAIDTFNPELLTHKVHNLYKSLL